MVSAKPGAYVWYVSVILALAYTLSYLDRQLPFILTESIKADLSLSDTQLGLLTGAMFSLVYCTMAFPIASIADRYSRKWLIAGSVFTWSGVTALGGLSQNFLQLSASRIGVAIGEAGCIPASHSMIADYFTPRFRARAMSIFHSASATGIVLGLGLGGLINEMANWRMAMILLGAPGLLLTVLIIFTVREPKRAQPPPTATAAGTAPATLMETLRRLVKHPTFRHLMIAGILQAITSAGLQAFAPSYAIRTFGLDSAQVGLTYGLCMGVTGIVGTLIGGQVADRLRRRRPSDALVFAGLGMLASAPCFFIALSSHSYWVFVAMLGVATMTSHFYVAAAFTTMQSLAEPRMHAKTTAIYLFALSGVGAAVGPLVVGMMSDWLIAAGSANSLRVALLVALIPKAWAGVHYFLAARGLNRSSEGAPVTQ